MEYLDPRRAARHRNLLFAGYILIAVAITFTALVMVYQAYGFGITRSGNVIQNGLTFVSSHPSPANIYVDGKLNKLKTNTRLVLPEGIYNLELRRDGYRNWQRKIEVSGGKVHHFDYPFLVPAKLAVKSIHAYPAAPDLIAQSPDRRWLVVHESAESRGFQVYDLKNPTKDPLSISLPASLATKAVSQESWQLLEWADDNQHVLLTHLVDGKTEYVLVDRTDGAQAQNLSTILGVSPTKLSLRDKKYDRYYLLDASTAELRAATLKDTTPTPVLQHVLEYRGYGGSTLLYVTDSGAPKDKVSVKLLDGDKTYQVRNLPIGQSYSLDMAKYSNDLYVAAGSNAGDKVYVYKDPIGQLHASPRQNPTPAQVLHVANPNYLAFSASAQFIVAENGPQFGVYDIENKTGYNYAITQPIDPPQAHATWMDGNRLINVSNGKLQFFDYDNANPQTLSAAEASYLPAFAPDYKYVYALAKDEAGQFQLVQTALLIPADL